MIFEDFFSLTFFFFVNFLNKVAWKQGALVAWWALPVADYISALLSERRVLKCDQVRVGSGCLVGPGSVKESTC